MEINNIFDIFSQIPIILEYFVPGFIFISVFQFFTSRKSSSYTILLSVVISYFLKAVFSILHIYIFTETSFEWNWRAVILSVTALLLSVIFAVVSENKMVNKLSILINGKSIHDDVWRDIIDYENGTMLQIYTSDGTYTGILDEHEENGNDSWFVLTEYSVLENGSDYSYKDLPKPTKLAINLKEVKRIELYYDDDTEI